MAFDPSQAKPSEALDQADQALYRAKGAGRNAVWIWDSAPPGADRAGNLAGRNRSCAGDSRHDTRRPRAEPAWSRPLPTCC